MRADHCPMANEPCQSICDTPCSAHRLKIAPEADLKVYQSIVDNYHRDAAPQPAKQPLTEDEAKAIAYVGPVYAPDGVVTRHPQEYRKELEQHRLDAIRRTEAAHGIGETK